MKYVNFSCKAYKQPKISSKQAIKTKKISYDAFTFLPDFKSFIWYT